VCSEKGLLHKVTGFFFGRHFVVPVAITAAGKSAQIPS
jgi:hypothetical protein